MSAVVETAASVAKTSTASAKAMMEKATKAFVASSAIPQVIMQYYSILRVLLVYEMTYDWPATFSIQSSFDGLEGRIQFSAALSKNWFASAIGGTLKMLPRSHRSFCIPIRHVRRCRVAMICVCSLPE